MGTVLLRPGFVMEGSTAMTTLVRSPAGTMSMVVSCSNGSWSGTKSISDR